MRALGEHVALGWAGTRSGCRYLHAVLPNAAECCPRMIDCAPCRCSTRCDGRGNGGGMSRAGTRNASRCWGGWQGLRDADVHGRWPGLHWAESCRELSRAVESCRVVHTSIVRGERRLGGCPIPCTHLTLTLCAAGQSSSSSSSTAGRVERCRQLSRAVAWCTCRQWEGESCCMSPRAVESCRAAYMSTSHPLHAPNPHPVCCRSEQQQQQQHCR